MKRYRDHKYPEGTRLDHLGKMLKDNWFDAWIPSYIPGGIGRTMMLPRKDRNRRRMAIWKAK